MKVYSGYTPDGNNHESIPVTHLMVITMKVYSNYTPGGNNHESVFQLMVLL